jgi:hypothetical protein
MPRHFSPADGVRVRRFGSLRPQEPRCAPRARASRGGGKRCLERVAGGHGRDLPEPFAVISRPMTRPLLPMERPREARRGCLSSSRTTIPLKRRQRTERAVRWMTAVTRPSKRPSSRHEHHPGRSRSLKVLPFKCSHRWRRPGPCLLKNSQVARSGSASPTALHWVQACSRRSSRWLRRRLARTRNVSSETVCGPHRRIPIHNDPSPANSSGSRSHLRRRLHQRGSLRRAAIPPRLIEWRDQAEAAGEAARPGSLPAPRRLHDPSISPQSRACQAAHSGQDSTRCGGGGPADARLLKPLRALLGEPKPLLG